MKLSFKDFQIINNATPTPGRARKQVSDETMKATWWEDIQAQTAYIYDYHRDLKSEETLKLDDLNPAEDPNKTALPIKFIRHAKQNYSGDTVTFWLQMQPGQECNVEYYENVLGKRYNATFPVGLYVDIRHEDGKYNRWLIVDKANYQGNQFPTFEILRCDYVVQWIHQGHKYSCPAVLRSQNSYNSGLWTDRRITTVEDQQKFVVPMNDITETLFYNHRMLIDSNLYNEDSEPRAWLISKINRISPYGICRVTLAQDVFDPNRDYIEKDSEGNIIGKWADYYKSAVTPKPVEEEVPERRSVITPSGGIARIRVGGTKIFTVKFYDADGTPLPDFDPGYWEFAFGVLDASEYVQADIIPSSPNQVRVTFIGDDSHVGKVLTVKNTSTGISSTIDVEVVPL